MFSRAGFLTSAACIALAVGMFALLFPQQVLSSKGVVLPNDTAAIWVREVGVGIAANGVLLWLVRKHADSPTLRTVLWANAAFQFGLFPIEILACVGGLLSVSGIAANSVLHLALGGGFWAFAKRRVASSQT